MTDQISPSELTVQRVRHPVKLRLLQVLRTRQLSPNQLLVTLGGEPLSDFVTASFDNHVKLMWGPDGLSAPELPPLGPDGPQWAPGAARPLMRDYTPRRFDAQALELDIEFALHGDGPAANWARQARPGQTLAVGGPKGSFVVPMGFDWHLLVGDDSALPAIARRLEELPEGKRVTVVLALHEADRRALSTRADLNLVWVDEPAQLPATVQALQLPPGIGHAWAGGEASAIADVRRVLVGHHGLPKERVRASAYWKRGQADHHESLEG
ncbi:MAG TPA: siderophore-interacting protein [Candidatus Aquabacterium excrementipullorum]|nr:siderophore-interacting protein [Candidatus Aquabacterium excrementipullorum]